MTTMTSPRFPIRNAGQSRAIGVAPRDGASELFRRWWVVLLRGLAAIAFGVITFAAPRLSLATLVLVFGAYCFADGVLLLVNAFSQEARTRPTWVLVLEGLAGIAVGMVALVWPQLTVLGLLGVIAAWAIVTGVFEIAAAFRLRRALRGEWLLALAGIASVGLGVVLLLFPVAGVVTLVFWTGAYALVFGVLMVALGLRLRARPEAGEPAPIVPIHRPHVPRAPSGRAS